MKGHSMYSIPQRLGSKLSVAGGVGGTLTTNWVGGTAVAAPGVGRVEFSIDLASPNPTNATSREWRVTVSDDGSDWRPVPSRLDSTALVDSSHSIAVVAGATVKDRIVCEEVKGAAYCRIETKATAGGALVVGDTSTAECTLVP